MRRATLIALFAFVAIAGWPGAAHAARAWGPPQAVVAGDGTPIAHGIRSVYTARGELIAAWTGPPSGVAVRPAGSRAFGPPFRLDDSAASDVRMATNRRGDTLVGWRPESSRPRTALRTAGGGWVAESPAGAAGSSPLAVAVGDRGDAAVAYRTDDDQLALAYRPPGGSFGAGTRISVWRPWRSEGSLATEPEAVVTPDGTTVVVWQELDHAGVVVVHAVKRLPTGAMTRVQRLSSPGAFGQTPSVTADAYGRVVAAWVEGDAPWGSGPVVTARATPGCCFSAPRRTGANGYREGLNIRALEPGVAGIAFFGIDPAPGEIAQTGPTAVGVLTTDGAAAPQQRVGRNSLADEGIAANARGDAMMAFDMARGVHVARRAPGQGFARPVGVVCTEERRVVEDIAMGPDGSAALWVRDPIRHSFQLIEDHEAASDSDCDARAGKRNRARAGRLALQARMPHGGRLTRGRWLGVRVSCGVACRVRAGGRIAIAGRRKRIPFTAASTRRARAGTSSLRVGLTRSRARAVGHALRHHRVVRARVQVRATGGGKSRTLTFRVRVRRR